jgi:hypothetical protein
MARLTYKTFQVNYTVLDEADFYEMKQVYLSNNNFKFYYLPSFYKEFKIWIYMYAYCILAIVSELLELPIFGLFVQKSNNAFIELLSFISITLGVIGLTSLFYFIPSSVSYIEAQIEITSLNKQMRINVLSSSSYEEYLQKR